MPLLGITSKTPGMGCPFVTITIDDTVPIAADDDDDDNDDDDSDIDDDDGRGEH